MYMLIGMLTAMRVAKDTSKPEIRVSETYPLNQAQISQFTEDLLVKHHSNGKVTVWDEYNSATELYKAHGMDIPMILPQNTAMVKFIDKMYL